MFARLDSGMESNVDRLQTGIEGIRALNWTEILSIVRNIKLIMLTMPKANKWIWFYECYI